MAETHAETLTVKKEDLVRCEQILDSLVSASEKYQVKEANQTLNGWRSKVKDLQTKWENPPKTKIAVYGNTGEGKSFFLNAFYDQPELLPTEGCGYACTSVITKVETVEKPDAEEGYQAEIIFITEEDWRKEISVLKRELINEEEGDNDVFEQAEAKLTAIYGDFNHEDIDTVVQNRRDVLEKLRIGKQTTNTFSSASELQEEIKIYIANGDDGSGHYWPIVKCVLIRLINPSVCGKGIQFVDLPGVADANPVRVKMAEDEKKSAKVLLVFSKIDRCLANPTVKSIVGDSMMHCQMEMDQQDIVVVCSRTDEGLMSADEQKKLKEEEQNIKMLKKQIAERVKQKQANQGSGDQCSDQTQLDNLKKQMTTQEESRILKCHAARIVSVKTKLAETTDSKVFCVSSMDYMKIANEYMGDGRPPVFKDKEDTEIPQVRAYLQKIASKQRLKEFSQIQKEFQSVVSDTYTYILNFQIGGKGQSEEKVLEQLLYMKEKWKEIELLIGSAIIEVYQKGLFPSVDAGVSEAAKSAVNTCRNWGISTTKMSSQPSSSQQKGIACNTYKAIVRRNGCFSRRNGGCLDFNAELALPLILTIRDQWVQTFRSETWGDLISSHVRGLAVKVLEEHSGQIRRLLLADQDEKLKENLFQVKQDAILKLQRLTVFEGKIELAQREAHRCIAQTIQELMIPTYRKCQEVTGKGAFDRLKTIMQTEVVENKERMFESTGSKLKEQLLMIKEKVCQYITRNLMEIHTEYQQQLEPLWMEHVAQKFHSSPVFEKAKEDLLQLKKDEKETDIDSDRDGSDNVEDMPDVPAKKQKKMILPRVKAKARSKTSQNQQTSSSGSSKGLDSDKERQNVATKYGKMTSDKETVKDMALLVKASQSVGLVGLMDTCATGTCFKVGSNYIMTANHVLTMAFGWGGKEFGSAGEYSSHINAKLAEDRNLMVTFSSSTGGESSRFLLKNVLYANIDLDVAVVELEGDASRVPSLSVFTDTKDRKVKFHLLGHDGAYPDQYRDPNCSTVDSEQAQHLKKQLLQQNINEHDLQPYDCIGKSDKFLHFQCCFKEGASGSPGLVIAGGRVHVLTMLLKGYPKGDFASTYFPTYCVEEGVRLKAVMDDMKEKNITLCKDIFHKYHKSEIMWHLTY